MGKRTSFRKMGTAAAAVGAAVLVSASTAGAAQAMPSDHPNFDRYCTSDQVHVTTTRLDSGMGKSGTQLVFTARPGQSCLLGGAPGVTFTDPAGHALDIPTRPTSDQRTPVRVDQEHSATASLSFQRVNMNTGRQLSGPTPASMAVTLPAPMKVYTVTVPWISGVEVPSTVHVTPVSAR
ncbi:hypothetical protein FHX42_005076 [Saccharopolyspora lacisalsi]|uniref:DUF4232 domain-containing protein n=1 Tax=Halosaccharopolyspora lacisalsi TaxID=1000566 RepID=A0A839E8R9_9PSEU|nr:DUF4232 domain-containing protein [Halosaccharopolyspora lacisalsi]MBA8827671.1 hypothetical protein [Halosaccharopolyspora lacisalsi]